MRRLSGILAVLVLVVTALIAPRPAAAGLVIDDVTVVESFDPLSGSGSFEVTNNSLFNIFAFAVTNDFSFATPFVGSTLWLATKVNEADWDANVFAGAVSGWNAPVTGSAGLDWDTLFGDAIWALVYWVGNTSTAAPIGIGDTVGEFGFLTTTPASTFVAFGDGPDNPYVVGETTQVSEPSAVALLGTGLLAAVFMAGPARARRRR